MTSNEITCFIVMPFSSTSDVHTQKYWDNHYEYFLKKNIEEIGEKLNLKIKVERSSPIRGNISNKIIFDLVQSDIVIADLTDFNRNVMWEIGVRQSFKNATILIGEEGTENNLPFAISKIALLDYNIDHNPKNPAFTSFIEKLKEAIIDCIQNPDRSDSPVLEAISGRGTFYEITTKTETQRKIEGMIAECEYNESLMEKCLDTIVKHRTDSTIQILVPSQRMRTESIALLMTHRYLNENSSFYDGAVILFWRLDSIDKVLEAWILKADSTIEVLEKQLPLALEHIRTFIPKIREIHDKIMNMI